MTEDPSPREAEFSPTHLVVLDELSQTEKDHYFDLMIESNAQFHRDYEKVGPGGCELGLFPFCLGYAHVIAASSTPAALKYI